MRVTGVHYSSSGVPRNFKRVTRPVVGAGGYVESSISIAATKSSGRYRTSVKTGVGPKSFNREGMIRNQAPKIRAATDAGFGKGKRKSGGKSRIAGSKPRTII